MGASSEMVLFANKKFVPSKRGNLKFVLQQAQDIEYSNQFDIVFSSFALQWILELEKFFRGAYHSLKKNGLIACTIPLSISEALEDSLAFLLKDPQWVPYFEGFTLNYYLRNENVYNQLLRENGFAKTHFEVVNQEWLFPSRSHFELYTLMWLPHLSVIPEHLQNLFFKQLMDKYVELNPIRDDGRLSFLFGRVDFIAKKKPIS